MKKENYKNIGQFILLIMIVLIIWFGGWWYIDSNILPINDRGAFGDKFGFSNSLFSALALAGIIYSILLQQKELNLQGKELSDTRDEFKNQNFQTTFFNLLTTQSRIADEIRISIWNLKSYDEEVSKDFNGRRFFNQSKSELSRIIIALNNKKYLPYSRWDESDDQHGPSSDYESEILSTDRNIGFTLRYYGITEEIWKRSKKMQPIEIAKLSYGIFFNKFNYVSGHYFRHIYHILNFLSNTEKEKHKNITDAEKINEINKEFRQYADFVQAQMSAPELFLLFYNSLTFPKLQLLLIQYQILENLPVEDLISPAHNAVEGFILKSRKDLIN